MIPATAPAPAPAKPTLLDKARNEIVIVLGAAVTVGEAVLQAIPAGTLTSALQVALPAAAFAVTHLKTISLVKVDALIVKLTKK